jgi:hypothetical protein
MPTRSSLCGCPNGPLADGVEEAERGLTGAENRDVVGGRGHLGASGHRIRYPMHCRVYGG